MTRDADAALLAAAVRDAADLSLKWFARRPAGREKSDGSGPVSDADLAVDALLRERLTGARPDYGWLSEESAPSPDRLSRRRVWLVDPIDGTRAFLEGRDEFTISAALVEDGAPVLAAIAAPARGEVFFAERGAGATLGGRRLAPAASRETLDGAVLLGRRRVIAALAPAQAGPFYGSIVYRVCAAALGRADAAVSTTAMREWDVCAAHLLAAEVGLATVDAAGAPLRYNKPEPDAPGLICASAPLVAIIRDRLAAAPEGPRR